MAGYARLQTLPCRLTMASREIRLGIVVPSVAYAVGRGQTGVSVAGNTELVRVVTVAAARLAIVSPGRMTLQEVGSVVRRRAGRRVRTMAFQAIGPHVAARACFGRGRSLQLVLRGPVITMPDLSCLEFRRVAVTLPSLLHDRSLHEVVGGPALHMTIRALVSDCSDVRTVAEARIPLLARRWRTPVDCGLNRAVVTGTAE